MVRYAKLPLAFNLKAMQAELLALKNAAWKAHFNTHYYEGSWTALALRSPDGSGDSIIPDLMAGADYSDTGLMQQFPSVTELLSRMDCPVMAVRFLNLQAGAIIKPHRDKELAFEKGEARLHFTVITNPQVSFYIENEQIPLNEGDCWYINANLPHSVSNHGATDRIHLVIDCKVNDWLAGPINSSQQMSVKYDTVDNNEQLAIIKQLRLQNTDTANKLALELEQQLKNHD
jgi:quercetin dioxygenase-like cupin family protein